MATLPVARGRRPLRRGVLGLALLLTACGSSPAAVATPAISPRPSAAVPGTPTAAPADLTMALGQIVGVAFSGREVTPALRHLIVDDKVGTVVLLPSNFVGAAGLRRLTSELGALGREAGLPAPLLVCLNQEGGQASAVADGVPPLPSAESLGARGPAAVREAMAATARGLRSLGVGLDLAPVSDLRTNPADGVIGDRAYGSTPAVVGPLVAAAVAGLHDGGVGSTVKHFPGLGGQAGDPHKALPTDPMTEPQWLATHARAIGAGIDAGTDAVMTTELVVPGLDPTGTPAVFSPPVVAMLRERLHFGGVIITDSLSMGGIQARMTLPEAAVAALEAGNDLMLLSNGDPAFEAQAVDAMRAAIVAGRVSPAAVRASAERVVTLRKRYPVIGG
ncbi:MAG TPA: glycoside hydrolase family 3 N-terminal domain-containing protein [Candidatus Dormibacteraeota bacterium]